MAYTIHSELKLHGDQKTKSEKSYSVHDEQFESFLERGVLLIFVFKAKVELPKRYVLLKLFRDYQTLNATL